MGCTASSPSSVFREAPTIEEGRSEWSTYDSTTSVPLKGPNIGGGQRVYFTWDRNEVLPIRYAATGLASEKETPAMTIPQMFSLAVEKHSNEIALAVEDIPFAIPKGEKPPASIPLENWKTWTYQEYYDECCVVGKSLIHVGLMPKGSVCIFGFNSPEWFMAAMACTLAGGCSAGIYPSDTIDQVVYKAKHSGAVVAFVESRKKAKAFLDHASELPMLKAIVVWTEKSTEVDTSAALPIYSWKSFNQLGKEVADEALDKRMFEQEPGGACVYIYTSGTTGQPKAVMVSHDNILFLSKTCLSLVPGMGDSGQERIISYLPLSHVAGMMIDITMPLTLTGTKDNGYTTAYFARPYDLKIGTIGERLKSVKPTLFLGVPRVWEKIQAKLTAMAAANPTKGVKKVIKDKAFASALYHHEHSQLGGDGGYPKQFPSHEFLEKKVLSVVKAALGLDECKFCGTAAAPIAKSTLDFFGKLGLTICELYGMSECTGATTFSTPQAFRTGWVGWAVPGTEVTIRASQGDSRVGEGEPTLECPNMQTGGKGSDWADASAEEKQGKIPSNFQQGEICYRGRHIMMGYMANPDLGDAHVKEIIGKNFAAIDSDGWLRSGDKGVKDECGVIKITGRYKELIIGAGGENVAPIPVEEALKAACPAISEILMVGNMRPYCVALITLVAEGANNEVPGTDNLDGPALALGATFDIKTISEAVKSEGFMKAISQKIDEVNKNERAVPKPPAEIKRFTILPSNFSVQNEEFTPTFKLKRAYVENKFKDVVSQLYDKDIQFGLFVPTEASM